MTEETTPKKAFVASRNSSNNEKRIKEAEEELAQLEGVLNKPDGEEVEVEETKPKTNESEQDLSPEEKSFKKRYGDLRRHQQETEKKLQQKIEALEQQLQERKATSLPKTKDEVEAWMKKYPDVAGIVKAIAAEEAEERTSKFHQEVEDLKKQKAEIEAEKALTRLRKLHPDFDTISESDDFHTWLDEQPTWVQSAMFEDLDVKSAARVLDLYKVDKNIKTKSPIKEAATEIKARNRSIPTDDDTSEWFSESQIRKMSDKEYAAREEEIEKAIRSGKFKYDISGAAR